MVEPWITPPSWVLYRFFHQGGLPAPASTWPVPSIPSQVRARQPTPLFPTWRWRGFAGAACRSILVRAEPFVGLPYLATFGFKVTRPLPVLLQRVARAGERVMAPLTRWLATRIFVVLEKPA